jgi:hypothetical protein
MYLQKVKRHKKFLYLFFVGVLKDNDENSRIRIRLRIWIHYSEAWIHIKMSWIRHTHSYLTLTGRVSPSSFIMWIMLVMIPVPFSCFSQDSACIRV